VTELARVAPLVFGLLMIVTGALGMAGRGCSPEAAWRPEAGSRCYSRTASPGPA